MNKTFTMATVKSVDSETESGEFEIIMSTESVDRDGEIIAREAFAPLPESIPVHAFHDFHDPIGRAFPEYRDGQLIGRGYFGKTARAQEIRQLVADGIIGHTSVGFMAAERTKSADNEPPVITSGELLEVSFVSVPSNRDAAVLAVKEYDAAATKANKSERIQSIHDLSVANGATCSAAEKAATPAPETPAADEAAGKSPASEVVPSSRTRVSAFLLANGLQD